MVTCLVAKKMGQTAVALFCLGMWLRITTSALDPAQVSNFTITPKTVNENHTFKISCTITGNPEPVYTIKKDTSDKILKSGKGSGSVTVTSLPAKCDDMGYWVCTGYNSLNNGTSAKTGDNLTVLCPPRPCKSAKNDYLVKSRLHGKAVLSMTSEGYPYPHYTWTHEGKIVPASIEYDSGWRSSVNITKVEVTDFGNYTLTMSNDLGNYMVDYQIVPYGPPESPRNLTYSDLTADSVTLHWISGYDMGSPQRFFISKTLAYPAYGLDPLDYFDDNSTNHGIGNHITRNIRHLRPDTNYTLYVSAENHQSVSWASNWVNFRTKALYTHAPHTNSVGIPEMLPAGVLIIAVIATINI